VAPPLQPYFFFLLLVTPLHTIAGHPRTMGQTYKHIKKTLFCMRHFVRLCTSHPRNHHVTNAKVPEPDQLRWNSNQYEETHENINVSSFSNLAVGPIPSINLIVLSLSVSALAGILFTHYFRARPQQKGSSLCMYNM